MTDPKGAAWRQTIYYPYYFASIFGRGKALNLMVDCPGYDAEVADNVPYIDISGVENEAEGTLAFFAVNRHGTETLDVEVELQGYGAGSVIDHQVMTHANLEAVNTAGDQNAVAPSKGSGATLADGKLALRLPPYSYQMVRIKIA
jgi:alpha-L-arabinofuranosidase